MIGDICCVSYHEPSVTPDGFAWFYNKNWASHGIWCLRWSDVEEINEVDSNE